MGIAVAEPCAAGARTVAFGVVRTRAITTRRRTATRSPGRRAAGAAAAALAWVGVLVLTLPDHAGPLTATVQAGGAPSVRPTGDAWTWSPQQASGPPTVGDPTAAAPSSAGHADPSVPAAPNGPAAIRPAGGRRGLWNAIGRTPTAAELSAAPALYGVVVLNIWETAALRRLKQLDPSIVVLAYQDLSSSRSYDLGPLPPAGIGWREAQAHPSWFALDRSGRRIEWSGYPGHWQMAVWEPSYQAAWVANVTARLTDAPWDGVLADNDLSTLRWYSGGLLSGTGSRADTDARIRAGLLALVDRAGAALKERGRLMVPNVSDARLYPGRWAAHSRWGGAMEENLVHFGTDDSAGSFVTDWGRTGWVDQTAELGRGGLALAVTRAAPGDLRALRYGYASLLVRGDADSYWQPSADAEGAYAEPQSIPEMSWRTGAALTPGTRTPSGAWARRYEAVWAVVNPTGRTVTVTAPSDAVDTQGERPTTVRLAPATGLVLRLP
jgi:hypothetical protein